MAVTFASVRASRIGVALELEGTAREGLDERLCHGVEILLRVPTDADGRVHATRGDDMRRLNLLLVAVAMFVAGCSSGTTETTTASSDDVAMTWDSFPFPGPVKLTGSAVNDGVICASGQSFDVTHDEISEDEEGTTDRIEAKVVCDEGSGIFVIRDDSKRPEEPGGAVLGVWTIESGTDDYAQLTGNGTSEWSGEITKTYVGELSRG
jgi:hypothetical protein